MSRNFLIWERSGAVLTLVMNEPETRNALSGNSAAEEFESACDSISRDASVRAVVITGAGSSFSAGGNLEAMRQDWRDLREGAAVRRGLREGVQRLSLALFELEVPLIAAVNGPAIGGGCDLACLCDIRIASEQAKFAANFVRLGLVPALGGAWLLPRIVGTARATQMCLSGEPIDAAAALACGLVGEIVAAGELRTRASAVAHQIAAHPVDAVRMTKRLLRNAGLESFQRHLETAAAFQALALHTSDHELALSRLRGQRSERAKQDQRGRHNPSSATQLQPPSAPPKLAS